MGKIDKFDNPSLDGEFVAGSVIQATGMVELKMARG